VRTAMVLSDRTIKEEIAKGRIIIEPLDMSCIQPASLYVHLDKKILAFIQVSAQNGDGAYLRRTAEGMG
jgi:deoxycytidine triphosphate deaminase